MWFLSCFPLTVEADMRKASKAAMGQESVRGQTRKKPQKVEFAQIQNFLLVEQLCTYVQAQSWLISGNQLPFHSCCPA